MSILDVATPITAFIGNPVALTIIIVAVAAVAVGVVLGIVFCNIKKKKNKAQ